MIRQPALPKAMYTHLYYCVLEMNKNDGLGSQKIDVLSSIGMLHESTTLDGQ